VLATGARWEHKMAQRKTSSCSMVSTRPRHREGVDMVAPLPRDWKRGPTRMDCVVEEAGLGARKPGSRLIMSLRVDQVVAELKSLLL
jgi:hypothetical protein